MGQVGAGSRLSKRGSLKPRILQAPHGRSALRSLHATHLRSTAASSAAAGSARPCARQGSSAASTLATPATRLAAWAAVPALEASPATSSVTGPPSCAAAVTVCSVLGCSVPALCSARTNVLNCKRRGGKNVEVPPLKTLQNASLHDGRW